MHAVVLYLFKPIAQKQIWVSLGRMGEILPENWNGRTQVLCGKFKDFLENLDDAEIWESPFVLQEEKDVSTLKIHALLVQWYSDF